MRTPGNLTPEQKLFEAAQRILAAKGLNVVAGRFVESACRPGTSIWWTWRPGSVHDFRNRGALIGVPCKHPVAVRQTRKEVAI